MLKDRPIFILGCPRSGTTLLRLILTCHKNIVIPHEFPVVEKTIEFFNKTKKGQTVEAYWDFLNDQRHFKDLKIDQKIFFDTLSDAGQADESKYIAGTLRSYASTINRTDARWGDKNIGNISYLKEIFELFPDAKIVYITRDPKDVYSSFITKKWYLYALPNGNRYYIKHPLGAVRLWNYCVNQFYTFKNQFPDQLEMIFYEDLVHETEKTIRQVLRFVGEAYDENCLKFYQLNQEKELIPKERMEKYHENTIKPIQKNTIGAYKSNMSSLESKIIDYNSNYDFARYKNQMESKGYVQLVKWFSKLDFKRSMFFSNAKANLKKILGR